MSHSVLFILGATATGKSQLAIELALEQNLPVINCDSVQVYQKVNIGSAKPSLAEQQGVPHYLLDVVPPPQGITAGEYRRQALALIEQLITKSSVIVVGGSGFYVQALQNGMYEVGHVEESVKVSLEVELAEKGSKDLYVELKARDPDFAAKISERDPYRILRGLGILRTHGKTVTQIQTEFQQKNADPFPYLFGNLALRIDREKLRGRVNERVQKMVETGLIEEVRELIGAGLSAWGPMQSVGYKETQHYLTGKISKREELISAIVSNTMKLAKRQGTWLRRDQKMKWFDSLTEWEVAKEFGRTILSGKSSE